MQAYRCVPAYTDSTKKRCLSRFSSVPYHTWKIHCITHIAAKYSPTDIHHSMYQLSAPVFYVNGSVLCAFLSHNVRLFQCDIDKNNQLSRQWDVQNWISSGILVSNSSCEWKTGKYWHCHAYGPSYAYKSNKIFCHSNDFGGDCMHIFITFIHTLEKTWVCFWKSNF